MASVGLYLLLSKLTQFYAIRAVDLLGDDVDLFLYREVEIIQELEIRCPFTNSDDRFSESTSAGAALGPVIADDRSVSTCSQCLLANKLELRRGVGPVNDTFEPRTQAK